MSRSGSSGVGEAKFRRRAADRADELLDAALVLFSEKGFAETSVADIARRAGVTAGTVYLYFSSKDELLEKLIVRGLEIHLPAEGSAAMTQMPPAEAIRTLLHTIGRKLSDPDTLALPRLILRELPGKPELASLYRETIISTMLPRLAGLIDRGVASGAFRQTDPELAVRTVMGGLTAHIVLSEFFGVTPEGGLALEAFIDNHLDIVLGGLEAER